MVPRREVSRVDREWGRSELGPCRCIRCATLIRQLSPPSRRCAAPPLDSDPCHGHTTCPLSRLRDVPRRRDGWINLVPGRAARLDPWPRSVTIVCGIVALWARRDAPDTPSTARLLRRATERLAHRGPDGEGYVGWSVDGRLRCGAEVTDQHLWLGLGHRRLKILDLSDAGRQPMQGLAQRWITFNGEIYNYRELRRELASSGYAFRTGTDTEVILAAYDAWGPECVRRFNGMWAFVLYDPERRRVIASRDRLGVKPLYYAATARGIMFASEVGPLLEWPGVRPTIAMSRLGRYLVDRHIDDAAETIYRDIRELRGGHTLELDVETGAMRIARYWELPEEPDLERRRNGARTL